MSSRLAAPAALTALIAVAASAQQRQISVRDLVGPTIKAPDRAALPWIARRSSPTILERGAVFDSKSADPWLGGLDLVALLHELSGLDKSEFRIDEAAGILKIATRHEENVRGHLAWLRAQRAPVRIRLTIEELTARGPRTLLRQTRHCDSNAAVHCSDLRSRHVVRDYNVEIGGGGVSLPAPIVDVSQSGVSAVFRAMRLPGSASVAVDVILRVGFEKPAPRIDTRRPEQGKLDRVSQVLGDVALTCVLVPKRVASQTWIADGRTLRAQLEWIPRGDRAATKRGGVVLFASPLLHRRMPSFRWIGTDQAVSHGAPGLEDEFEETVDPQDDPTSLPARLERLLAVPSDSQLHRKDDVLAWRGASAEKEAARVQNLVQSLVVPTRVRIDVLDCPRGTKIAAQDAIPSDCKTLVHVASTCLRGRAICFGGSHQQSFLAYWAIEGADKKTIVDPDVEWVDSGYFLTATLRGRASREELDLDCMIHRLLSLKAGPVPKAPRPVPIEALEKPEVASHCLRARIPLVDGFGIHRRAAAQLVGPGRELVVVVRRLSQ